MPRPRLLAILCTIALASTRAFGAEPEVTYIPAAQVAATFAKGAPLLELSDLKVHASRRETPGLVEVHQRDTDVFYVLEGSATLVTGGRMVDGKTVAKDELRGSSIEGGQTRRIAKGDVIVIPRGVPHWFREVPGPLTYFAVKVTGPPVLSQ